MLGVCQFGGYIFQFSYEIIRTKRITNKWAIAHTGKSPLKGALPLEKPYYLKELSYHSMVRVRISDYVLMYGYVTYLEHFRKQGNIEYKTYAFQTFVTQKYFYWYQAYLYLSLEPG